MKFLTLSLAALVGCATAAPPRELIDARDAYRHAEQGPAMKLTPAELHVAAESLEQAEQAYKHDADSKDAVDIAYVALRKAQRADALGQAAAANQRRQQAERDVGKTQQEIISNSDQKLKNQDERLRDTQGALAHEHERLEKQKELTEKQKEMTEAERTARLAAEKKAADAMDALAKSLAVKTEARGTVITLSGGVVFATNQAKILPGAQTQLNQVADALKTQAEHHFSVEGHTDNQGTDAINDDLSARRAAAVRDYLIVRGVSANAISSEGYGSKRPVGDNKNPEGRAMNRRVEIIVDKSNTSAAL